MISQQVKEELSQAEQHLRTALAFASRSEESWVIKHISACIMRINEIDEVEQMTEALEDLKQSMKGPDEE